MKHQEECFDFGFWAKNEKQTNISQTPNNFLGRKNAVEFSSFFKCSMWLICFWIINNNYYYYVCRNIVAHRYRNRIYLLVEWLTHGECTMNVFIGNKKKPKNRMWNAKWKLSWKRNELGSNDDNDDRRQSLRRVRVRMFGVHGKNF